MTRYSGIETAKQMAIAMVMTRPRRKRYRSVPARMCWPLTISKPIRVKMPYWMA